MRAQAALWLVAFLPFAAAAQDVAPVVPETPPPAPARLQVLVVQQNVLFENSAFGRAAKDRLEAASNALVAENREIEATLEAEERALTEKRKTLPKAQFRALADAFNKKVERIRKEQDTKSRGLTRARDDDRQRFFQAAVPILADLMRESGAAVIIDQSAVVLNLDRIDITAKAIARIDAEIGTGALSAGPVPPKPEAPPTP